MSKVSDPMKISGKSLQYLIADMRLISPPFVNLFWQVELEHEGRRFTAFLVGNRHMNSGLEPGKSIVGRVTCVPFGTRALCTLDEYFLLHDDE